MLEVTIVRDVNLSDPMSAVVPSLDAAVLRVLRGTNAPLTGAEIHRLSRWGSYAGVQKVLNRLCEQGIVRRQSAGRVGQFIGNRAHLAWPAVEILAGLSESLIARIRREISTWKIAPVAAFLFGSAARGDGNLGSDVDIWLVRRQLNPEMNPLWEDQSFVLSAHILDWTGNHASILESPVDDVAGMATAKAPILDELRRDAVALAGLELSELLRSVR